MRKKILITFLFKEGAGPVFTLEMARGLAQNGCEVYVLLSSKISNRKDWENDKSFESVSFIETGTRQTVIQASYNFFIKEQFALRRKFRTICFDYVISTFYHPWASTVMSCFYVNKKVIICHDPIFHSGVGLFEKWMTTRYIKTASDIVVLTKSFIPTVEKVYGFNKEHIHYMPHGRMSVYKQKACQPVEKSDSITFLFFGRIEEYKGLGVLANAYEKISQSYSNVTLTIAGSGDFSKYKSVFENMAKVRIENRYIADEEIEYFFSVPNTVVVLPYLDASQSGVIPIALEYQTPIIASDTGGLKEQLNDGRIGLFCKAGDVNSLAIQMEYVLNNPNHFEKERNKMKEYLQCLDWSVVTKNIIQI